MIGFLDLGIECFVYTWHIHSFLSNCYLYLCSKSIEIFSF